MKKRTFSIKLLVLSVFLILAFSLTSCGWKPSEEEIQTLEETRSAALAAEKSHQDKKAEPYLRSPGRDYQAFARLQPRGRSRTG